MWIKLWVCLLWLCAGSFPCVCRCCGYLRPVPVPRRTDGVAVGPDGVGQRDNLPQMYISYMFTFGSYFASHVKDQPT